MWAREGISPMGMRVDGACELAAVAHSQGSRTSKRVGRSLGWVAQGFA